MTDWMDSGANSVIKCKEGLLTTPSELFTNVGKFRGSRDPREGGERDATPDCRTTHSLCFWPYSSLRYCHATPHCQHPHSGIQERGTRTSLGNLYTQTDKKIKTRKSQGKHEGYFCNWGLSYNEHNVQKPQQRSDLSLEKACQKQSKSDQTWVKEFCMLTQEEIDI